MAFPKLDLPPFRVTASGLLIPGNPVGGNIPSEQDHFTRSLGRWGDEIERWGDDLETSFANTNTTLNNIGKMGLMARLSGSQSLTSSIVANLTMTNISQLHSDWYSANTGTGQFTLLKLGTYTATWSVTGTHAANTLIEGWLELPAVFGAVRLGNRGVVTDATFGAYRFGGSFIFYNSAANSVLTPRIVAYANSTISSCWFGIVYNGNPV